MNFLAHLLLADPTHESRIGNVLADFTSVSNDQACAEFGTVIGAGIIHHREIDMFVDAHALNLRAVRLLFPRYRHYARIIVDVAWDYFLSTYWDRFCPVPLDRFIDSCHQTFATVDSTYPARFQRFAEGMVKYDILRAYRTLEGIQEVLDRMAVRIGREHLFVDAVGEIRGRYDEMDEVFLEFFPLVQAFAAGIGETRPEPSVRC